MTTHAARGAALILVGLLVLASACGEKTNDPPTPLTLTLEAYASRMCGLTGFGGYAPGTWKEGRDRMELTLAAAARTTPPAEVFIYHFSTIALVEEILTASVFLNQNAPFAPQELADKGRVPELVRKAQSAELDLAPDVRVALLAAGCNLE